MKTFFKDRSGNLNVLSLGLMLLLLLVTFLIVEMGCACESYEYCMDVLQRCCNSAVEANIDDAYRADRVLILDTAGAEAEFYRLAASDLSDRYRLTIQSVGCISSPPAMTVSGKVTFDTVFKQFSWDDLTVSFQVRATNYDLD